LLFIQHQKKRFFRNQNIRPSMLTKIAWQPADPVRLQTIEESTTFARKLSWLDLAMMRDIEEECKKRGEGAMASGGGEGGRVPWKTSWGWQWQSFESI
jgi:hypothetical protein